MADKPKSPGPFKSPVDSREVDLISKQRQYLKGLKKEWEEARDAQKSYNLEGSNNRSVALLGRMSKKVKQIGKDWKTLGKNHEKMADQVAKKNTELAKAQDKYANVLEKINNLKKSELHTVKEMLIQMKAYQKEEKDLYKQLEKKEKSFDKSEKALKEHNKAVATYGSRMGMVKTAAVGVAVVLGGIMLASLNKVVGAIKRAASEWHAFWEEFNLNMIHATQSLRDQIGPSGAMIKGMKKMAGMTFWKGWGMEEAANVAAKLAENMDQAQLTDQGAAQWIKTGVLASKGLGMGAEAAGDFVGRLHKGWQMSHKDIQEYLLDIKDAAEETGVSSVLIAKDVSENLDIWTKYGKGFMKMANASARRARQFGVSLKELLAVSDKFATFESAADNVGKLNAVMGLNLNTAKMLMATETERADILRQELLNSGKSWQNMTRFQREAVIGMTGWNAETAQAVLSTGKQHKSLKQLEQEEEKRMRQKRTDARLQKDANKAMKDMSHILNQFYGWSGKIRWMWIQFGEVLSPIIKELRAFGMDVMDTLIKKFQEWRDSGAMGEWLEKFHKILESKVLPTAEKFLNWMLAIGDDANTGGVGAIDNALIAFEKMADFLLEIKGYAISLKIAFKALTSPISLMVANFLDLGSSIDLARKSLVVMWKVAKGDMTAAGGDAMLSQARKDLVENSATANFLKSFQTDYDAANKAFGGTGMNITGGWNAASAGKGGKAAQGAEQWDLGGFDLSKTLETGAEKAKKTENKLKNMAPSGSSKKAVKKLEAYYEAAYKMAKKISDYDDLVLNKAQAKIDKLSQTVLNPKNAAMVQAVTTASESPNITSAKIGDVQILISDVIMDGTKVGKLVAGAIRTS